MSKNNDLLKKRLKELNENKKETKSNKPDVVNTIVTGKEEKPNFSDIASAFEERKIKLKDGAKNGYVKDTIYIRKDLWDAMQALCIEKGDKKHHVNAAYEDYISKMHRLLSE